MMFGGAALLSVSPTVRPSDAQVGYEPGHSPFHDIPRGAVWVFTGGYVAGERGQLGVGMANGPSAGLRYEARLAGAVGVSLGITYAHTTRFLIDVNKDTASRKTGPFNSGVVLTDAALQLVLTGNKTWRGLAPYIGAGIGLAIGSGSPPDTVYHFRTTITLAPNVGVRWYPARRLSVRTDFRAVAWKLRYPLTYRVPYSPDGIPVLPSTVSLDDWTWHPWLTIGVGWIF